jgi:hypothetical protein
MTENTTGFHPIYDDSTHYVSNNRRKSDPTIEILNGIQADVHVLKEQMQFHEMHSDHHKYISLLLKKEEQKIAFRQAIIEKTLSSLIWVFLCGIGYAVLDSLKDYFKG